MAATDRFLLECVQRALQASRQIRAHGTVRFRLEQLLSSAQDLLRRFARRRGQNRGTDDSGDDGDNDSDVVVQEELALEVRLEKPARPEKWDLPADMSLKSALQRAQQEAQSRLDGTLAVTRTGPGTGTVSAAGTGTLGRSKRKGGAGLPPKPIPRHERFFECSTHVQLTTQLHRRILPLSGQPQQENQEDVDDEVEYQQRQWQQQRGGGDPLSDAELMRRLSVTPFTRMVVTMQYADDDTLRAVSKGIEQVNSEALPDIQGTIRSHSFSEAELSASKEGRLDVLTGFMIIDDDMRLLVLEGKAAPGCGMQRMFTEFLPRAKANDEKLRILCNPEVLFPARNYPDFGPDIRRIRVRDKLKKLARRPEIYNRKQVEEICFSAIDGVMNLRRAVDMASTKRLDMYPTAAALNKLELLYGEAITKADMDGTKRNDFLEMAKNVRPTSRQKFRAVVNVIRAVTPTQEEQALKALQGEGGEGGAASPSRLRPAYEPVDCRNRDFEESLRSRPVHRVDYLGEQRTLLREAWSDALRRREQRDQEYEETVRGVLGDAAVTSGGNGGGPKLFMYSQQRENFKVKAFNQLRQRVAADRMATYSFSKDFISQTVCAVDEKEEEQRAQVAARKEWLTPSGFQYPKPKQRAEMIAHPKRPSDARVEELKEPFTDATDVPANASQTQDPEKRRLELGFQAQIKSDPRGLFGSLEAPSFSRPFQLKLVGDRTQLPRGAMVNGQQRDPNCFRSVHLGGEKQAQLVAEAMEQEKKQWADKVVVDSHSVKVGGFKVRDRAIQVDRTSDILKDPPRRKELHHLRNRKSHRGADWGYTTAPLSLLNTNEPFVSNAAANALVRKVEHHKFITAREEDFAKGLGTLALTKTEGDATGKVGTLDLSATADSKPTRSSTKSGEGKDTKASDTAGAAAGTGGLDGGRGPRTKVDVKRPVDFYRYLNDHTSAPKVVTMVAKRKHPPLDRSSAECRGPKWEAAGSK